MIRKIHLLYLKILVSTTWSSAAPQDHIDPSNYNGGTCTTILSLVENPLSETQYFKAIQKVAYFTWLTHQTI